MKKLLTLALTFLILFMPSIVHGKGPKMEIHATVESFTVVGDSLEIVFSGTMHHVSGGGTNEDHWGFSARVKKTKLVIPDRKLAYFFTKGTEPMKTLNLKDDFALGSKIYGNKFQQIEITVYDPVVHFDESISKITAGSICLAILNDTMSQTETAPKPETPKAGP